MTRYRLRVSLVGSDPEIWREFEVTASLRLRMLHLAVQVMMGWREQHLHAFTDADPYTPSGRAGRRWEPAEFAHENGSLPEDDFTVADALHSGGPLWYEYDFGDGWTHRLDVVAEVPDEPHHAAVVLLDGAERGAFEDSGGIGGYAEKLAVAADPEHPEHESIVRWIDATVGPWAADAFDLVAVQSELNLLFNPDEAGSDPYDMSGIVKSELLRRPGDVDPVSPIAALASALPPPIRSELRQHLSRTGILEPTDVDARTASRAIRAFAWLMDAVGTDGIALTPGGHVPGAVVLGGMTELGWLDDWIGKGNREDLTPPIAVLRETAQRLGLVRVQKGRLMLSASAKKALGDPVLQLRLVAAGLHRRLSDPETDAAALLLLAIADGTPRKNRWRTVAFGLEMCGWRSATGLGFTATDIGHATHQAQRVLDLIGDTGRRRRRKDDEDPLLPLFAREALR